jgi:hypothetical protein
MYAVDLLDWLWEQWKIIIYIIGGKEHPTYKKPKKANCIGHILQRNSLLKHNINP